MSSIDTLGLLLFLLQQFGVVLGVGASTFASMFYIVGLSDGAIDASEKRFMNAVYATLRVGLVLIISTGVLITLAHYFAGDIDTIAAPAYIAKWLLLVVIVATSLLMDKQVVTAKAGGAIAGASWYALFVLHTLSLAFTWGTLLSLYSAWLILFWFGFIFLQKRAATMYLKEGAAPVLPVRGPHLADTAKTTT